MNEKEWLLLQETKKYKEKYRHERRRRVTFQMIAYGCAVATVVSFGFAVAVAIG